MKELFAMLQYVDGDTETLAIAKGLFYLPKNLREVHSRNKKTIGWQMRST